MEFLVEFNIQIPDAVPVAQVEEREIAEASAARALAHQGHLMGVWKRSVSGADGSVIGLYRAGSEVELDGLLAGLPLYEWMRIKVTRLEPHPNDPARTQA